MKICVFGAGAMGGLLGARLAAAGENVSLVARGRHLAAMQRDGLRLVAKNGEIVVTPPCTDDPASLGVQDVVILAVKATALRGAADAVRPLLGPDTVLVPALNGVPWWYFYRLAGPYADRRLDSVDPGGVLWDKLPPSRVIGCVVYAAGEIVAPGVIHSSASESFLLGDPAGRLGARVAALSALCEAAGLSAPISPDIRQALSRHRISHGCRSPHGDGREPSRPQNVDAAGFRAPARARARRAARRRHRDGTARRCRHPDLGDHLRPGAPAGACRGLRACRAAGVAGGVMS